MLQVCTGGAERAAGDKQNIRHKIQVQVNVPVIPYTVGRHSISVNVLYLNRDEASGARVVGGPVMREPCEVILSNDVMVASRRRIETVQNDSDE